MCYGSGKEDAQVRCPLAVILLISGTDLAYAGGEFRWPDNEIRVPPLVQSFIAAECLDYQGTSEEPVDSCIVGERAGYRATVMMLSNAETGEKAAERYRACRAGLGAHGGRFHRRRAECVGSSLGFRWRFDGSDRAALPRPEPAVKAAESLQAPPDPSASLVHASGQNDPD